MKNISNREEATEMLDVPKEFTRKSNTLNYPEPMDNNIKDKNTISADLSEKSGIEQKDVEMTWEMFVRFLDNLGLYVFSFLFLTTT